MKDLLKVFLIFLAILILWFLWGKLIYFLFVGLGNRFSEIPILKERFGTIMWHSNDKDGIYLGSFNNPNTVDHIYCYYPKASTNSKILIKRQDNGDCSDWYGSVIFREGSWVSEIQKYDGL